MYSFALYSLGSAAVKEKVTTNYRIKRFSDRDLLDLGSPLERLSKNSFSNRNNNSTPDTLNVLAIRVEFQEDTNILTTGNGKFDLSENSELFLDPPPHDLNYFEDQLTALSYYFRTVSKGKLILEYEVFPKNVQSSFTVSEQMSSYVPTGSDEQLDIRLSEFFAEGFQLADQAGEIDFSEFDVFILFHAGVGSDFAFEFDPTPQDVPSVFLDFETLRSSLGNSNPDYQGISVNSGNYFIKDGIILPETQTQEEIEIALLGTMTVMMGNQLGLPILFNPDTGRSGVGVFGLMDQGSGNFSGLIPAEPCAWEKIYLGWEKPILINRGASFTVAAPHAENRNKIYKIPISSSEYFLVENRIRDLNKDGIATARDGKGTRVEFRWSENGQEIAAEDVIGVITSVSEYDYGLPFLGENPDLGILIWHIDETIIAANLAENRVNADLNNRGVDLEEADGAQDIGQVYGLFSAGAGAENGLAEDAWWGSNPIITEFLRPGEVVSFGPETTPSTNANDGSVSHLTFTNFSEPDSVMTFDLLNSITQTGFPQYTGATGLSSGSAVVADLNGDAQQEIIVSTNDGNVLAWNSDGSKFINSDDSLAFQQLNGNIINYPFAIFAQPGGGTGFTPAIAEIEEQVFVVVTTKGKFQVYSPEDTDLDDRADLVFDYSGNAVISTSPMILHSSDTEYSAVAGTEDGGILRVTRAGEFSEYDLNLDAGISGVSLLPPMSIVFVTNAGHLGVVDGNGTTVWIQQLAGRFTKPAVLADINGEGNTDIVAITTNSASGDSVSELFIFDSDGNILEGFPVRLNFPVTSEISVADIDSDQFMEIAFQAENKLVVLNHLGFLENNFPVEVDGGLSLRSTPVLADLDGDDLLEILVGRSNNFSGFDLHGDILNGFPLPTGGPISSTAFISDCDQDNDIELVSLAEDGFLYVWDLPNNSNMFSAVWTGYGADIRNSNGNYQVLGLPKTVETLMPSNSVYNYPNPANGGFTTIRYRLNHDATVKIKIYDLAGEFVDELSGTGYYPAENEIRWNLENIESGVYLAKVEATAVADNDMDVAIIKIAVIK